MKEQNTLLIVVGVVILFAALLVGLGGTTSNHMAAYDTQYDTTHHMSHHSMMDGMIGGTMMGGFGLYMLLSTVLMLLAIVALVMLILWLTRQLQEPTKNKPKK